jgi:hypothetical protein
MTTNTNYVDYFSRQRRLIGEICKGLSRFKALRVRIERPGADYQILEPFSYLPSVNASFLGVPKIYAKYLQKSSLGKELDESQTSYRNLRILVWSQCRCTLDLRQAWNCLQNSKNLGRRLEAWDVVSSHSYEECIQQVCQRQLYKAWEFIENGNLDDDNTFRTQNADVREKLNIWLVGVRLDE